jgi:ketosteroid isomerase-like protein
MPARIIEVCTSASIHGRPPPAEAADRANHEGGFISMAGFVARATAGCHRILLVSFTTMNVSGPTGCPTKATARLGAWCGLVDARMAHRLIAGVVAWAAACGPAGAADGPTADVAAIRAAATAYRAALEKGDAATIRRAWTADGDVVDGWGNLLSAADATQDSGGAARPEVRVGETRLRFLTPDVALEDGSVDVVVPGTKSPLSGWFSAIWVKQGGEWKLAGIREAERSPAVGPNALDDLEWMVGDWTLVPAAGDAQPATPKMDMSVRWDAGRMFLVRDVRLTAADTAGEPVTVDVQQRIGWDPLVGRIRSWSFATDGTRGEATWFRDGSSWIARVTTIPADGAQATAVHIYTFDGRDRCEWRTLRDPFAADDRLPVRATWIRKPTGGAP